MTRGLQRAGAPLRAAARDEVTPLSAGRPPAFGLLRSAQLLLKALNVLAERGWVLRGRRGRAAGFRPARGPF